MTHSDPRAPRWLRPETLSGTVALFFAVYLVWQPVVAGLLLPPLGRPRPATWAAWRTFLLLVAGIGAVAGALYWWAGRRPPGIARYWGRSTACALALGCAVNPRSQMAAGVWLLNTLVVGACVGLVFCWLERWERLPGEGPPCA